MKIKYTKEGLRIIHPSGVNQLLTLEDLHRIWEQAKVGEKKSERYAEEIHDFVNRIEALQ